MSHHNTRYRIHYTNTDWLKVLVHIRTYVHKVTQSQSQTEVNGYESIIVTQEYTQTHLPTHKVD